MRKRILSPGYFENPDLAALEPYARLLFAGLWCHADKEGRLADDHRRVHAAVFPYEPGVNVQGLLIKLEAGGFIERYSAGGQDVICIPAFLEHQQPHPRETPSKLPPPTGPAQGEPEADPRPTEGGTKVAGIGSVSVYEPVSVSGGGVGEGVGSPEGATNEEPPSPDDAQAIKTLSKQIGKERTGKALKAARSHAKKAGKELTDQIVRFYLEAEAEKP